eukprot:scaffold7987_cov200-Cylindrotheca_fusiformis.AAC.3
MEAPQVDSATEVVLDAQVVAMLPPRPDSVMTLLHDDDYLPGVQTLLYSLRKRFSFHQTYPPEIVVLVTSNVTLSKAEEALLPSLCTRILPIEEWAPPTKSVDSSLMKGFGKTNKRTLDDHNPGWTKLRIFGLQQYETILYIDSDCLVLKDVSHLLDLNKVYSESEALIAAAPDVLPPSNFNSGVMVIRPSTDVFQTMQRNAKHLTTYDGSDTGFLNAYYPTWFQDFPPDARLPTGYNAQTALHNLTADSATGESTFWDAQLVHDLHIVHYSGKIKPWQGALSGGSKNPLQVLWKTWYQKSKNFLLREKKERAKAEQEQQAKLQKQTAPKISPATSTNGPKEIHRLVSKRYKELRAQGMSTRDAMQQARTELQPGEDVDAGSQVAAMFGMR